MEFVILSVGIVSSIWVYFDARRIVNKKTSEESYINMSPLGWSASCLLFGIVVFPLYLLNKHGYLKRNFQTSVSSSKRAGMTEKFIFTDPEVAVNIQNSLIDPRTIDSIILTTTQDQPSIQGFHTETDIVLSVWAGTNKTCAAVMQDLPKPKVLVHVGMGSGADARAAIATEFVTSLIHHHPNNKPKICVFIQPAGVPQYPPGKSGPRYFHLITICANSRDQQNDIRILDNAEILPEYDATGMKLVRVKS